MFYIHRNCLLSATCSTVGRLIKTLEFPNSYRVINRLHCFSFSLWLFTVEARRKSIDIIPRPPQTINFHKYYSPILPGYIHISGNSFLRTTKLEGNSLSRMCSSSHFTSKLYEVLVQSLAVKTLSRFYYPKWWL
jgi:hypothetical protein